MVSLAKNKYEIITRKKPKHADIVGWNKENFM